MALHSDEDCSRYRLLATMSPELDFPTVLTGPLLVV